MGKASVYWGEKMRSIIHLCPPLYKLCLTIVRDYGKIYFNRIDKTGGYRDKLKKLKGTKNGKACFIIGNGPSLCPEDLEEIGKMGFESFAANKIYKIFESTSWRPTYYAVVDWKGIDEEDASTMQIPHMFFSDYYWRKHNITNPNSYVFYGNRLTDSKLSSFRFSDDITKQIYVKGSVTYTNFQIAMYMGYSTIYLIGMDNSYAYVMGRDGKTTKASDVKDSHFYKDENPSHIYSEKEAMDNCFIAAKKYADKHGVKIINATRGGKLELFERIDFDTLVNNNAI